MALGKLSDTNLALSATLSSGVQPILPLANMQDESRFVTLPARLDCTDLAASQFEITLDDARLVSMVALLFHTMTLSALYRITIAADGDADYSAPVLQTDWEWVFPSIYDPVDLEPTADNFLTGTVTQGEVDLIPRHVWIPFGDTLAWKIKVELDDHQNTAGYIDVGGLQVVSGFSPAINFDRGRQLSIAARDLVDEAPSGRLLAEERTPRRQLQVSYSNLEDAEALRFVDAALRARTTRTVIVVPDVDDPAAQFREAFPAVFQTLPGAQFTWPGANGSSFVVKEILA